MNLVESEVLEKDNKRNSFKILFLFLLQDRSMKKI